MSLLCSGQVAIPIEIVIKPIVSIFVDSTVLRSRSAILSALWLFSLGKTSTNSSPPIRATISSFRDNFLIISVSDLRASSPLSWPKVSLTRLKKSMSISKIANGVCLNINWFNKPFKLLRL